MYRLSKNLKLEFKVEHEQDIFSWDFNVKVNIWYYNFTIPFSNK
jgi:hypothetical protein